DPNGEFTDVWVAIAGTFPPFADTGIYGQRFSASGAKLGGEFQVNTDTTATEWGEPSVAKDSAGNFIVVWSAKSGSDTGIFGRRFDSAGSPLGDEFQISPTGNGPSSPSVAFDASNNFVVVWAHFDILGQRYDSTGNPVGGQFQANTGTTAQSRYPNVAIGPAGDFVVAWARPCESYTSCTSNPGVFARRFDNSANPTGGEIDVTKFQTTNPGIQHGHPSLAMDAHGNFAVAWEGWDEDGDGSSGGVFVRAFDNAGFPRSGRVPVNTYTTGLQEVPTVGMDDAG